MPELHRERVSIGDEDAGDLLAEGAAGGSDFRNQLVDGPDPVALRPVHRAIGAVVPGAADGGLQDE